MRASHLSIPGADAPPIITHTHTRNLVLKLGLSAREMGFCSTSHPQWALAASDKSPGGAGMRVSGPKIVFLPSRSSPYARSYSSALASPPAAAVFSVSYFQRLTSRAACVGAWTEGRRRPRARPAVTGARPRDSTSQRPRGDASPLPSIPGRLTPPTAGRSRKTAGTTLPRRRCA